MRLFRGLVVVILSLLFIFGNRKNESVVYTVDIGVNVSDTVRSLAFYTKVLGMKRTGGTWHASKKMSAAAGVNSGTIGVIGLNLMCDGYQTDVI